MQYDKPILVELSSALSLILGDKEDVIQGDFGQSPAYHSVSAYQADE
jgi:hypothetical protein